MEHFFLTVLNMSIAACYVIPVVIIARWALQDAPKIFAYSLWLVVLFRLFSPLSFTSFFSFLRLPQAREPLSGSNLPAYIPSDVAMMPQPTVDVGISGINQVINNSLPPTIIGNSINPLQVIIAIATLIWLCGIAILLLYSVISYWRFKYQLRTAVKVEANIYTTENITAPLVCGFFGPKIYLPLGLSQQEQSYILEHEKIHLQRLDYWTKPLFFLAVILHWFNPLVWLSYVLFNKDLETSCDEAVLRKMGDGIKVAYSRSLLSLSLKHRLLNIGPLAFGEVNTKKRVANVLKYKKMNKPLTIMVLLLTAVIIWGCMANPPQEQWQNDDAFQKDLATSLFEQKTPYLGNNVAVNNLVGLLPLGSNLLTDGIKLQTTTAPYELTIKYQAIDDKQAANPLQLLTNTILLFATIDNVEIIHHQGLWNNPLLSSLYLNATYTRQELEQLLALDFRQQGASPQSLEQLITYLGSEEFQQKAQTLPQMSPSQPQPTPGNTAADLNSGIAQALLSNIPQEGWQGECGAEGHRILAVDSTPIKKGHLTQEPTTRVYLLTTSGKYGFENGCLTKVSGVGVTPMVMTFRQKSDGSYQLIAQQLPLDGSDYALSLQEMFPENLQAEVFKEQQYAEELWQQEKIYATQYLQQLQREAEIVPNLTKKTTNMNAAAANRVFELYADYPTWIGTLERIEQGSRYVYETTWQDGKQGNGIITFRKYLYDNGTTAENVSIQVQGQQLTALEGTIRTVYYKDTLQPLPNEAKDTNANK